MPLLWAVIAYFLFRLHRIGLSRDIQFIHTFSLFTRTSLPR